jgi:hypothetical protein
MYSIVLSGNFINGRIVIGIKMINEKMVVGIKIIKRYWINLKMNYIKSMKI